MTTDERFDRIETDLAGTTAILREVAQIQHRIEENLEGLIRAITAEHGNGKQH